MKTQIAIISAVLLFVFSAVSVSAASYTISYGWNMVSFDYDSASLNDCIDSTGNSQASSLSNFYYYNAKANNYDMYEKYPLTGSMTTRGRGFWIYKYSTGTCVLNLRNTYNATIIPKTTGLLYTGWNQVGTVNGAASFGDVKGNCNIIGGPWEWNNAQNKYVQSTKLEIGKGYWIYIDKNCRLEKTCVAQGGTCRAWDPINGNCYSSEKEIFSQEKTAGSPYSSLECSNNILQTHCCVPK